MELINTKIRIPQKYANSVKRITFIEPNEYTIELHDDFIFSFGESKCVEYSQEDVLNSLKDVASEFTLFSENLYTSQSPDNVIGLSEMDEVNIATELLLGNKNVAELIRDFGRKHVLDTLKKHMLNEKYYGNFRNMRNGSIIKTCRFFHRFDLVVMFEKRFYGISISNNKIAS